MNFSHGDTPVAKLTIIEKEFRIQESEFRMINKSELNLLTTVFWLLTTFVRN